jgi:NitT/TauT family transport system substrate-binding protein
MNSRIFIGIIILVTIFAAFSINQFTGQIVGDADYVVQIGYKANANYVPLFVALENGYFDEEGVRVETIRFDSTNTLMDAFAAGRLDATPTGNVIVSYALENNQLGLFKMYSFAFYTDERHPENLIVGKDSGIEKYSDLEGKNIGSNKGIFARTMVKKFLEKQGVKDFNVIELGSNLQLQALESGQIDALISLEPFPTIGVEKGIAEYLEGGSVYVKTVGFTPSFSGGVISTKLLNEHPEETKKFLRAMEKSIDFISSNFDESKSILPKYVPIEQDIAEKITFPEYMFVGDLDNEKIALIQKTADFLHEEGIIKAVNTQNLLLESHYFQ